MKIKPEHFAQIKKLVEAIQANPNYPAAQACYERGDFYNANKTKDLNKRFRWDIFWMTGYNLKEVYQYANNEHVDTALRQLIPPTLQKKFI